MSFDVSLLSRDHILDRARPMTAAEEAGVLTALKAVVPGFNEVALGAEYQTEAHDGGAIDLLTGPKDASALLVMRGVMPSHCVLIFEMLRATNWVAAFSEDSASHTMLATAPVGEERGANFEEEFGEGAVVIVQSPQDVAASMGAAFENWQEWAGFDEAGRRKEM